MAERRFGPVLDAGVVIREKDAEKTILPSALGSTAYVGVLEKGPVGKLIQTSSKRDMLAKVGGYIPESLLPDNCADFWDHSQGAGSLLLYRVTDGKEEAAKLTLYNRKTPRTPALKVEAKNGGSWGGKRQTWVVDTVTADVAETSILLPIAFHPIKKDQFKGAKITLPDANAGAGASFTCLSNNASNGTTKTTLTLTAEAKAATALGTPGDATPEVYIELLSVNGYGQAKHLAVEIKDGQQNPSTEWGAFVYLDGSLVLSYPDLSSDPNAANYFVEMINEDLGNQDIKVTDLWVGAVDADVRPANHFGTVASGTEITASQLKIGTVMVLVDSSLAGANTIAAFTYGNAVIGDVLEATYNAGGSNWTITSTQQMKQHAFAAAVNATPYVADNPYTIGFTITESTPANGQKFKLTILPVVEQEAVGGRIYFPLVGGAPANGFLISSNTEKEINIASGDLTLGGTLVGNVKYRLEYKQQLEFGYDGISELATANFTAAYNVANSPFNSTVNKGYGLIKFATPGITSYSGAVSPTLVEKAGVEYAAAKNHAYRYEIPKTVVDEFAAKAHVHDTLGKSMFAKVIFPSWAHVPDPVLSGRLKQIPITGMVQGREALTAANFLGYHKAAAGVDVTLPRIVKIPTGDTLLNGEVLNPAGLQRVIVKAGNFVVWGARCPTNDTAFKFAQHREQLSYYEHVIQENFDYIIFAINDKKERPSLISTFNDFFLKEWRKRALRGDTFQEAMALKIDDENNTNATMAAGDLNAELKLRLADTVERFIVTVSKAGVFEDLAP